MNIDNRMNSVSVDNVAIIGCGIIGLSVANIIQERFPNIHIDIYAANTNESTTSWGAAGFLKYNEKNFNGTSEVEVCDWMKKSANHFWNLYRSSNSVEAGILLSNCYVLSKSPFDISNLSASLYEGFRKVDEKEIIAVGFNSQLKYGFSFISTLTESRYYLPFLTKNFEYNGGTIIKETLSGGKMKVADWALKKGYNIVFNCSGLGSRELFDDDSIIPLRGQIIRVDAPWMKYSFITDDDTYAYCGRESAILGGFRQPNDWDLSIRANERNDILKRIIKHNICLGSSRVIEEWTGLRPWRPKLRLEIEHITSSSDLTVPVIHNYGHGSSGIGLSWGTSLSAVDLMNILIAN